MRLTVVGSGTSEPQAETPASGILVETTTFAVLVDCGQGVVRELLRIRDPRELDAIVVGHMHADHYIGLISLRYLLPWTGVHERLDVYLPPGGRARIRKLAAAISERPDFFDDAFRIVEYDPAGRIDVGDMTISFIPGLHYVPAWGCSISDTDGRRIVISGDTGPNEELVAVARGADVLVAEATLPSPGHDDPRRGHLTPEEALDIAARAGVPRTILVHYPADLRARIDAACAGLPGASAGEAGLVIDVGRPDAETTPAPDGARIVGDAKVEVAPARLS
ncbi:MAG TPA: MBL fold metallo-hydrolase [Candidatus Limnocylindrales bacterium]|nr:MBL fold metallo-hydrolase [Candidatus Limnocylindrales bacterium]